MELESSARAMKGLAHVQLAEKLRSMLKDGEFLPGQLLPSTKELAKRLDTYGHAVHKAMGLLADEGLVERKPHVGTVVTGAARVLRTIGVYMTADAFGMGWSHNFVQAIFMHLSAMAHEEGVALDLYLDPRKAEDCDCLLEDFVRAAKARKFQAILSLSSDIRAAWMERLGLPMAAPGGNIKARIGHAEAGLASSIAEIIASKGFRSAAVITTYRSDPGGVLFFKGLREQFAARGIELREEWLRNPLGYFDLTCAAAFGYQQMNTLWQLKKRPEAVAVFPDILVPGVVCSALELGLGRSGTPGFIFHKNRGNAPFCPFSATWIVADPGAFATAMFRLVRQQIAGVEPSAVNLNFSIEPSA